MKTTQNLLLYLVQQQTGKLNLSAKRELFKRIFRTSQRCFSTVPQEKLKIATSTDGIIRSPFPDISIPNATIDQFVWENLDKWPDHTAIECAVTGQKYTFSQLRNLSRRFAASLRRLGMQPGDVLAVMLPNIPDYAIIALGALEAGVIVSSINPVYTPYELSHQLTDCSASVIITLPEHLEKLEQAKNLIQTKTSSPYQITTITVNQKSQAISSGVLNYQELISDNIDTSGIRPSRSPKDIAFLPYSSGTTGLSKGVELTHENLIANFLQVVDPHLGHIITTSGNHQDILPGILPFFHIYGLSVVLLRCLSRGCKIVSLPKFEALTFLSILKDHKASVLYAVPPVVLLLGHHEAVTKDHFTHLRNIINGAGPVGATDAERVIGRSNSNFTFSQAYGLTETSPVVFVSPIGRQDYTSLGTPIRSTQIKVVKPDGSLAEIKEHGEFCVRGPQVMKGYRNKPQATAEVIDGDGFFHTGDVGYCDEDGRFYIVERMKELIKVQGFQVPPAELEAIIRSHPAIMDAGVIGVPDQRTGEKPLAFAVKKDGVNVSKEELKDFVAERVAPFKKLGGVVFIDSIPKNPSGKILRRVLKENYQK